MSSIYDISCADINFAAKKGCFFSDEKGNTTEMGKFEWVLRYILSFLPLIDSPEKVCIQRSWKFLENLPKVPQGVAFQIENYFNDSRSGWNKLHHIAQSITKIYAKKLRQDAKEGSKEEINLDICQEPKKRVFTIRDGKGDLYGKAVNSLPYKIELYKIDSSKSWKLAYTNNLFLVDDSKGDRVGEVNFDYESGLFATKVSKIKFTDRNDKCLFEADAEDGSFIFREENGFFKKGKKLAIAVEEGPQKWALTFLNPHEPVDGKVRDYMAVALAKHAENYLSDQDAFTVSPV